MLPLPTKAYLFIGFNVVRFLSILTLILVFSSTIVVMAGDVRAIHKGVTPPPSGNSTVSINGTEYYYDCDYLENSTVPLQIGGAMFAILNHIFILFQCILLLLSEVGWPSWFFNDFIPVLGRDHGVAILGFVQIFIGAAVLSHHVATFALVSAVFLFVVGCINLLLGLVFRAKLKSTRSLSRWREERKQPSLPRNMADFKTTAGRAAGVFGTGAGGSVFTHLTGSQASVPDEKAGANQAPSRSNTSHAGYGFGRQGMKEKNPALVGLSITRPADSLPKYPGYKPQRSISRLSRVTDASSQYSETEDSHHTMHAGPSRARI